MKKLSSFYVGVIAVVVEIAICSPAQAQFGGGDAPKKSATAADSSPARVEPAAADICQCVGEGDSTAAHRIEQALAGPLRSAGLDYSETPLQDVVSQLQDDYGIQVRLNKPALEEAGIGTDAPVTIALHNISLNSALRLMLNSLQLRYVIDDEVLMITTQEDAEMHLKICVYDARKIIPDASEKNVKTLIDTIKACVDCSTWAESGGGNAEIRALPNGLIVVTQTQAVHHELQNLLTTIRGMSQNRPTESHASAKPATADEPKREPTPADEFSDKSKSAEKPAAAPGGQGGSGSP